MKSLNNRHIIIRHASISRCKKINASNACYYNYAQGLAGALKYLRQFTGQFDLEPPPPKITRFQDAISSLEEVQSFPDWRGFSEEAITIASSMNKLTYFHCESLNSARQTTLDDYFHPIYLILYYSIYTYLIFDYSLYHACTCFGYIYQT